jgi:uncharacterized protein YdhG (YjbR/CyaY superfamily)
MTKPTTVDQYLRALPADQRRALEKVRAQIKSAAPKAEEHIGYGLAGFKVDGRPLIYFGAAKNHCALYGARADDAIADKLKGFRQSKGTIQFTPDKPIPAAVVKQIVKARLAALEERAAAKKKPTKKKAAPAKKKATKSTSAGDVEALLAKLDHPRKAEIEAVRSLILGADKRVREEVKWNAPSFYITEHFATFHLHARDKVQVVFHTGAKLKANAKALAIDDPTGILKWMAKDRCLATLKDMKDVRANKAAFVSIVRQWIKQVPIAS